ncbi:Uncharacterised protein [uncultured archaeon]|nr:Uncharacterised protein [uncultured archaeon]
MNALRQSQTPIDDVGLMRPHSAKVGIIVGEHPLEEGAMEAGKNLVDALTREGIQTRLYPIPLELTYLHQLPPLFEAFRENEISGDVLMANLQGATWNREALEYIRKLAEDNPETTFYSMHNYTARLDKATTPYSIAWPDDEFSGHWTKLNELKVGVYEGDINDTILAMRHKIRTGEPLTPQETALLSAHILVEKRGSILRYQTGDRRTLQIMPEKETPEHQIPARVIELPAVTTNFLGRDILEGALEDDRLRGHPALVAPEKLALFSLGVGMEIENPWLLEKLVDHYERRWSVLGRNANRKLGLTGGYVVNPLAQHIKQEIQGVNLV